MAVSLGIGTWLRLIIWMLLGVVVYFFYSRHHSVLRQSAPQ
jgi:APA family basic amino acid/polyamine antiporter